MFLSRHFVVCKGNTDVTQTETDDATIDHDGLPNIPEPTNQQLQCIIDRTSKRQEIADICGVLDMASFSEAVSRGG